MIVRREAMEKVGILDEDYFLFFEETDWCYRMREGRMEGLSSSSGRSCPFSGKGSRDQESGRPKSNTIVPATSSFKKNRGELQWFLLLIGLILKLGVELLSMGMGCLATLFLIRRWRKRLSIYAYLMAWHLRFCPRGMGLKPSNNH